MLVAVAVGGQQLMGFTRAWFGHRSDRIPISRLRRTPFIVISTVAIALLFGVACQLVLRLATSMEDSGGELNALLMALLILVFVGIGTAIAAGGTAFSALIADRTTEAERPRVLSVVWGMRLLGVLLGSVLVNQVFGSACAGWFGASVAGDAAAAAGAGGGVGLWRGAPHHRLDADCRAGPPPDVPQRLALPQLLLQLRTIPQAGRFLGVLCLFTFSMFLNDAVLEPYGAAVFGMSVCATTSLNVLIALGFFAGLGLSGFWLIERAGNIRTARVGAVLAALALLLMLGAGSEQSIPLLRTAVGLFGLSLGVCMNACLTLMFSFVQPGRTGFLLGVWGAGYAYSCGLATISGGGLLTLLKAWNGGDLFAA